MFLKNMQIAYAYILGSKAIIWHFLPVHLKYI